MEDIAKLEKIVATLRGEYGCPWDKKQTPKTLKHYLLEEVYELIDAIEEEDPKVIEEELGDVLFILIFLIHIYKEGGYFDLKSAIEHVAKKMVHRHPHVFGKLKGANIEEIQKLWHEIKGKEKPKQGSFLDNIPKTLPALMLAYEMGKRAAKVGFDWKEANEVFSKIAEEIREFKKALKENNPKKMKEELGDIIFSWVNVARLLKIQPEDALRQSALKFRVRFQFIEKKFNEEGKPLQDVSLEEMDALWEQAKTK
jgi:tetrapyrrole methylase family protein/MazG family protein/ATP diphosphatase